jgi:3-methyladenine DNA glycosylase AlkD
MKIIKGIVMKEKIRKKLFKLADKKYKEFHSSLCPGINNIIGVRVPILRNYAKELIKEYDIEYLLLEIQDNYYEEIMLKGMLIGLSKNKDINILLKYIEQFIPKIDNWAICDTFCAGLKITQKHKQKFWDFIQIYLKSDKEFEIRFGIVMILDYYIEEEYLEKDFKIFDSINSKEYYVQMAVAWATSICLIKFYDKTIEYLQKCKLDKFTFNKSLTKAIESYRISNEKKIFLRTIKRV